LTNATIKQIDWNAPNETVILQFQKMEILKKGSGFYPETICYLLFLKIAALMPLNAGLKVLFRLGFLGKIIKLILKGHSVKLINLH